jgi:hypothetical protein
MTSAVDLRNPPRVRPRRPITLTARIRISTLHAVQKHRVDVGVLGALGLLTGWVHATGMSNYPNWVDDPGTYLSQAWAVQYEHGLSPYTYFYDHAPGGWVQIALWSWLPNGFGRHAFAFDFGNECMLIAKLVSTALIYLLGRRLGFGRPWSSVAVLLYALCPLVLVYTRWTYLDNCCPEGRSESMDVLYKLEPDRRVGWAIEQLADELAVQPLVRMAEEDRGRRLDRGRGVTVRSIDTARGLDGELTDAADRIPRPGLSRRERATATSFGSQLLSR